MLNAYTCYQYTTKNNKVSDLDIINWWTPSIFHVFYLYFQVRHLFLYNLTELFFFFIMLFLMQLNRRVCCLIRYNKDVNAKVLHLSCDSSLFPTSTINLSFNIGYLVYQLGWYTVVACHSQQFTCLHKQEELKIFTYSNSIICHAS